MAVHGRLHSGYPRGFSLGDASILVPGRGKGPNGLVSTRSRQDNARPIPVSVPLPPYGCHCPGMGGYALVWIGMSGYAQVCRGTWCSALVHPIHPAMPWYGWVCSTKSRHERACPGMGGYGCHALVWVGMRSVRGYACIWVPCPPIGCYAPYVPICRFAADLLPQILSGPVDVPISTGYLESKSNSRRNTCQRAEEGVKWQ